MSSASLSTSAMIALIIPSAAATASREPRSLSFLLGDAFELLTESMSAPDSRRIRLIVAPARPSTRGIARSETVMVCEWLFSFSYSSSSKSSARAAATPLRPPRILTSLGLSVVLSP